MQKWERSWKSELLVEVQGSTRRQMEENVAWGKADMLMALVAGLTVSKGATGKLFLRIIVWHLHIWLLKYLHCFYEHFIIFKAVILNCFPSGGRKSKF